MFHRNEAYVMFSLKHLVDRALIRLPSHSHSGYFPLILVSVWETQLQAIKHNESDELLSSHCFPIDQQLKR